MHAYDMKPTAIRVMGHWIRRADAVLSQQGRQNAQESLYEARVKRVEYDQELAFPNPGFRSE
jgi:hypothetical protein